MDNDNNNDDELELRGQIGGLHLAQEEPAPLILNQPQQQQQHRISDDAIPYAGDDPLDILPEILQQRRQQQQNQQVPLEQQQQQQQQELIPLPIVEPLPPQQLQQQHPEHQQPQMQQQQQQQHQPQMQQPEPQYQQRHELPEPQPEVLAMEQQLLIPPQLPMQAHPIELDQMRQPQAQQQFMEQQQQPQPYAVPSTNTTTAALILKTGDALFQQPQHVYIFGCRNFVPTAWNAQVERLIDAYWRQQEQPIEKSSTRDVVYILNQIRPETTFWDKYDGPRDARGKLNALGVTTWRNFTYKQLTTDKELKAKMRFPMETGLNRLKNTTISTTQPEESNNDDNSKKRAPSPLPEPHPQDEFLLYSNSNNDNDDDDDSWKFTLPESNLHDKDDDDTGGRIGEPLYGRQHESRELATRLGRPGALVSLVGRSGVGKTHLARSFAWDWYCQKPQERFGFWLNAANESTIRESYEDVLKSIRRRRYSYNIMRPAKRKVYSITDLANLLWQTLAELGQFEWILVYDNVPVSFAGGRGLDEWFLPPAWRSSRGGRILILTNSRSYAENTKIGYIHRIEVGLLDSASAVDMLKQNLAAEQTTDDDHLQQLVEIFGCLPLAIATAKGVLLNSDMSVQEYIQRNNFHVVQDKVQQAIESSLASVYERGLGIVLDIAVYLHCDYIPLELLGGDDETRQIAVALTKWNILKRDYRLGNMYSMHRLHQAAALQVSLQRGGNPQAVIDAIYQIVRTFDRQAPRTWEGPASMVKHVKVLVKKVEEDPQVQVSANKGVCPGNYQRIFATTLEMTALVLRWVDHDFQGAEDMAKRALRFYNASNVGVEMARVHVFLGKLYRSCTRPLEAIQSFDQAHALCKDQDPQLEADILDDRGRMAHNDKDYANALGYFEQALKVRYKVIPRFLVQEIVGDYQTRREAHNGLRDEGLQLLKRLMEIGPKQCTPTQVPRLKSDDDRKLFGDLGDTLVNFGRVYRDSDGSSEVETWTNETFGRSYDGEGHLGEALFWFEAALGAQSLQVHTTFNDSLATTVSHIGRVFLAQEKVEEASRLFDISLEMKRNLYGAEEENESIASALYNIATAKCKRGELLSAQKNGVGALQAYQEAFQEYKAGLDMLRSLFVDANQKKRVETRNGISRVGELASGLLLEGEQQSECFALCEECAHCVNVD